MEANVIKIEWSVYESNSICIIKVDHIINKD